MESEARNTIFGDTRNGVPSPTIPHVHPWPTRYHGPVNTVPVFGRPYRSQPYQDEKQSGMHPAFVRASQAEQRALRDRWLGLSGGLGEPILCASTGNTFLDAGVGAVVGYLATPKGHEAAYWTVGGAAAGALGGLIGYVLVGAVSLYVRSGR